MAQMESISHSGIDVQDLKAAEEVLDADISERTDHQPHQLQYQRRAPGRSVHTSFVIGDWLFAVCPLGPMPTPPADTLRGTNGFRHAPRVTREASPQVVERLRARAPPSRAGHVSPPTAPLASPALPGPRNFIEVCWRRDVVRAGDSRRTWGRAVAATWVDVRTPALPVAWALSRATANGSY